MCFVLSLASYDLVGAFVSCLRFAELGNQPCFDDSLPPCRGGLTAIAIAWDDATNHSFRGGTFLNRFVFCAWSR